MTTPATTLGNEIPEPRDLDRHYAGYQLFYQLPYELRDYIDLYREPTGSSVVAVPVSLRMHTARTDVDALWPSDRLARLYRAVQYLRRLTRPLSSCTVDAEWQPANTFEGYHAGHLQTIADTWERRRDYQKRIGELARFGAFEDILLNEASENDFWTFERSPEFTRPAGLALMENGNLPAVWKGNNGDHIGLHFIGDRTVNYVIFKQRLGAEQISRVAGNDTLDGVKKQIRAFDLASLVNR
jgi:hypothetical protein